MRKDPVMPNLMKRSHLHEEFRINRGIGCWCTAYYWPPFRRKRHGKHLR